ncbi:uncharacterized protein LOC9639345 [Selaginella moellendorffii]|uniref:uncharacterized protein LOC9639345 n=1 Tax=Selaginella moellendorffii TaxID=88036 RepID=UPI000D1CA8C5|nr:uncharacterized protein LOC9639345 [Selaginella moellendorffii]|eukprot:XP_024538319.1 uncharacterized protein LOC9639345 [Selaginella moellendorffii]
MGGIIGVPVIECVYLAGCAHWAWKRCIRSGEDDSRGWAEAEFEDFKPVPHMCRLVLAVYEKDLANPRWAPPGGYGIKLQDVVKRVSYKDTRGKAPPYLIYLDRENCDIVMAIRGLNLVKESDYAVLLDNKLGKQMFEGGYVHHGLLKSAAWVLNKEVKLLKQLVVENPSFTLTCTGHSLGSGVAALLTVLIVKNRNLVGNIAKEKIRCYAIAPARCMSLNLAVRYADVINSVILQDDFLPRTATPLEDMFKSLFCLPCLLCIICVRDTFLSEAKMLKDPRRLYTPGRIYHIVERKVCRCGTYPPVVKTAVPVDGRFERIVLSSSATSDHSIVWIHREGAKALELMEETATMQSPTPNKMVRQHSIQEEHMEQYKAAMERAKTLNIPHAHDSPSQSYGTFDHVSVGDTDESDAENQAEISRSHSPSPDEEDEEEEDSAEVSEEESLDKWKKFLRELFPKDRYERLLSTG